MAVRSQDSVAIEVAGLAVAMILLVVMTPFVVRGIVSLLHVFSIVSVALNVLTGGSRVTVQRRRPPQKNDDDDKPVIDV